MRSQRTDFRFPGKGGTPMKLIFGRVPCSLKSRRYRKYTEIWDELRKVEPGTWIAVSQEECGGKRLTTKQNVLIVSARRQGLRIATRTDDGLVFVQIRTDEPSPAPQPTPKPAPETDPEPEPEPEPEPVITPPPIPEPVEGPSPYRVRRPSYGVTPIPMRIRLPTSITAFRQRLDQALKFLLKNPDPEDWQVIPMVAAESYFDQLVAEAKLTAQHRCLAYVAEVEVEESDLYIRLLPATDY